MAVRAVRQRQAASRRRRNRSQRPRRGPGGRVNAHRQHRGLPVHDGGQTAVADRPRLPGAGLLAHVIVSKYGDHLPLYRLEHIFSRWGVSLARQTLCDWLPACAELLRPLYQLMAEYVLQSWVLGTDERS